MTPSTLRFCAWPRGEHIAVIDAAHDYFECEIASLDGDLPLVRITRHEDATDDGPLVILVQGLAKGEKMDSVIRHATELGVTAFMPLTCERSIVKLDAKKTRTRLDRWCSIAKSAAMQSGQPRIPEVLEPPKREGGGGRARRINRRAHLLGGGSPDCFACASDRAGAFGVLLPPRRRAHRRRCRTRGRAYRARGRLLSGREPPRIACQLGLIDSPYGDGGRRSTCSHLV